MKIAGMLPLICLFLAFSGCIERRIDKLAHSDRIAELKLFTTPAPPWGLHHIDMPQFTIEEREAILGWLAEGKVKTNPVDQAKSFQFLSTMEKLLSTGDASDKIKVLRDVKPENLADLVPTQFEIYWGNIAPKVIDTLSPETKFSACDGSILAAVEKGRYYVLDGHHRWATCLFVRRFLGKADEYHKLFAPFKYFEERKIYELLADPQNSKLKTIPDLKVTALEGNPQGILRVLYEFVKLGHGHFSITAMKGTPDGPLEYFRRTLFLENPLLQWLYFGFIIVGCLVFGKLFILVLRLKMLREDDGIHSFGLSELILQTLRKYIYSIMFLVSLKLGLPLLKIPPNIHALVQAGLMMALIWLVTIFTARLFANSMLRWQERLRSRPGDSEMVHLFPLLIRGGKIIIYFIGFLFMMNRIGYNVYSAIAGLSVGGLALAMAGREAVSHIFAGISLYIDKVVKEGDYLLIDNPIKTWGRVEKVGMRSTTIRTKYNSILVLPNSILANGPVNNITAGGFKRMYRGRILLAQETGFAAVEQAIAAMRQIAEGAGNTHQIDIHFMKFDAFGFYIRVQYFVEPYTEYHDTVSRINLAILKYLEEKKILLAVDLEKLRDRRG